MIPVVVPHYHALRLNTRLFLDIFLSPGSAVKTLPLNTMRSAGSSARLAQDARSGAARK